jgi:quercetin dioxygenase-like cupin family protein
MRTLLAVVALTATAGFAQDVVKVAPELVKVLVDNDQVRVLRFTEAGHVKVPMHSHPAYVSVGFTNDDFKYTFADGKSSEEKTKAGAVAYSKAVTHASENLSSATTESILVELKGHPAAAAMKSIMDPVKVDPKHYSVVLENDRVRVLRAKYGPHEKSVMHEHPNAVAVFMTDAHFKFTMADGTSQDSAVKARDANFTPAGKHLPENLTDKPMEAIVIELK